MLVNKKINGIHFVTTSHNNARTEKPCDLQVRKQAYQDITLYNAKASDNKQFLGFCIGFIIDGNIYAGLFDTATALQRVKLNGSTGKILTPLGAEQVRQLAKANKLDFVCSEDRLVSYMNKMHCKQRDKGTAFQKYLNLLAHRTVSDLTNPFTKGGDLYRNHYEVKLMTGINFSQGQCKLYDKMPKELQNE